MKRVTVLYRSSDVHIAIKRLFAGPVAGDRRVVVVAYVGSDALALLPSPKGVLVICSPEPMATSHVAVQELIRRGAAVLFSDRLHAKVYWSRKGGAVVGSANLTRNALGVGGLKEAGIYLPPGAVDIDKLIANVAPRPVTKRDLEGMARAAVEARARGISAGPKSVQRSFSDWYSAPLREGTWKLCWWTEDKGFSPAVLEVARTEHGKRPYMFMEFEKGQISRFDYLLTFRILSNGTIGQIRWMFTDLTVPIPRHDKAFDAAFPFHAVQLVRPSLCPEPPFVLTPEFRTAFRIAATKYGLDRLRETVRLRPPVRLLDEIERILTPVKNGARRSNDPRLRRPGVPQATRARRSR